MNHLIKLTVYVCLLTLMCSYVIPIRLKKISTLEMGDYVDHIFLKKQNKWEQKSVKSFIAVKKRNPYRYRHFNGIKSILGKIRKYG